MSAARPTVAFDHVQVAVADLASAARRLEAEYGLVSLPGGRHPGKGTGNMIVPLGGSYLELIAIVEPAEAAAEPRSMRVARAVEAGRSFAVWVARTEHLDAMRAYLAERGWHLPEVGPGARQRPDGVHLSWRMQELVPEPVFSPLPFLIEWRVPPGQFPGDVPAPHRGRVRGVAGVRLTDPDPAAAEVRLREVIGGDIRFSIDVGEPGVAAIVLDTDDGELTLT